MLSRFLLSLTLFVSFFAQAQNKGTLKGVLKDSTTKQPVALATVTVFQAADTAIITYRLSDDKGVFSLPGLPLQLHSRVVVTFQGYRSYRKEFTLSKEQSTLDLGTVLLAPDARLLDEVTVVAERPPVVMRNDTLEFNAAAFKTLPSALLEDLLKKLPGVDVDLDGNLTVKGKKVNRLLVDGKDFFGGDHKMTTRNLPANIVDKVQVLDDKEELENNPQLTKDEVGQVVNIKLKKAIKQGWFGKAYAGVGTDNRHEAGGIVNMFRDTAQLSLLGYSNNVNKPSFNGQDLQQIGGFNRSGGGGPGDGGNGNNNQGIQSSRGGGFNYNNQYGKKWTMNLQYFYGQITSEFSQLSNNQRFFADTVIATASNFSRYNDTRNHRIAGSLIWKDSLTTITFRPNGSLSNSDATGDALSRSTDNYKGDLNANKGQSHGIGHNYNYTQSISLSRRSRKKKGRFLNINSNLNIYQFNSDNFNDNFYTFYSGTIAKDSLVNQLRGTRNGNKRGDLAINLTEPLRKNLNLTLTNQTTYLAEDNVLNFYDRDLTSGKYDVYSSLFSNGIERAGWKNTLSAVIAYTHKKLTVRPGVSGYWASLENDYTRNPGVNQHYLYIYPTLNINWKAFNFGYRVNINEPGASDLQPVIDISNPLYRSYGNPDLLPAYNQSISLSYYKYSKKGNSFNASINGSFNRHTIIRQTTLDSRRVQETRAANINGGRNFYGYFSYSKQHKFNQRFRMSLVPGANANYNRSFVSFNGKTSQVENFGITGTLRAQFNYKDIIELNQRYGLSKSESRYEDKSRYKNVKYTTHTAESELTIRWPRHFVWENIVAYTYNPQVGPGIRKAVVRWNAGASFLFLKQDKGQIKLSAYDVLNQNVSSYRYIYENNITDGQTTTLRRYYMLSFIYTLRTFSGGKTGEQKRTFSLF